MPAEEQSPRWRGGRGSAAGTKALLSVVAIGVSLFLSVDTSRAAGPLGARPAVPESIGLGLPRTLVSASRSSEVLEAPLACPSQTGMRNLIDDYLATPNPNFPDLGSTVSGLSVSIGSADCGTFTYAAGLRDVERNKLLKPKTLMGLASMSKAVIAAVALILSDRGEFGPSGLNTTVDRLLTADQIAQLTVGDDPAHPRCPGVTPLWNRATGRYELQAFSCPDLSQVTLRNLMVSNHGMYDFVNEVLLPNGFFQYDDAIFFELFEFLGFDPVPPPNSTDGFEVLKAYGLKRSDDAVIGGNLFNRDMEISVGNTGFQLLGIILEKSTGQTLDRLIDRLIVRPLHIDDIRTYLEPAGNRSTVADGYWVFTDEPLIEETGIYPLVDLHGHTAVNTLSLGLGLPANINLAGGAGSLVANMPSYRTFFKALVSGGLLSPAAQEEFDGSYVEMPDVSGGGVTISNGLGVVNLRFRGVPGLPDFDAFEHYGFLPGVRCFQVVLVRVEPPTGPAAGAMCLNSTGWTYPDPFGLWMEFWTLYLERGT